eukprot:4973121-Prymnesium_polylepis.1
MSREPALEVGECLLTRHRPQVRRVTHTHTCGRTNGPEAPGNFAEGSTPSAPCACSTAAAARSFRVASLS